MKIINLSVVRAQRDAAANAPDADCVVHDADGVEMYRFAVDFAHADKTFTFMIFAYSAEDAEARAASIRSSAAVSGQIVAMGPL